MSMSAGEDPRDTYSIHTYLYLRLPSLGNPSDTYPTTNCQQSVKTRFAGDPTYHFVILCATWALHLLTPLSP